MLLGNKCDTNDERAVRKEDGERLSKVCNWNAHWINNVDVINVIKL